MRNILWPRRMTYVWMMLGFLTSVFFVADGYSQSYTSVAKWGSLPAGDRQFKMPSGVAADASGNVYVADTGNHRIQKFSPDGTFIAKWGSLGSGDGQFNWPTGIAIDGPGNIYVADAGNHRLQKFSPDGTFIAKWGSLGTGNGQFNGPSGVTVDHLSETST